MMAIAAIDLIGGQCVRLYQGDFARQTTYGKTPVEQAREFEKAGFGRLHVIDLEGARAGAGRNREVIGELVESVGIPLQVGGGIRSDEDVAELLELGVQHLILGTVALSRPEKVSEWIEIWEPSRFILSLDLKNGSLRTHGWLEESRVSLEDVLKNLEGWRIPQVICTDIASDGTLKHPHYATYEDLRARLPRQTLLIAAGGVSRPEHLARLSELGVHGAVLGRALYEGEVGWEELISAG